MRRASASIENQKSKIKNAFTLIEIMVVILILGVLVTLVIGVAGKVRQEFDKKRTIVFQDQIVAAIRAFRDARGYDPNENYLPNGVSSPPGAYPGGYGSNYTPDWNAKVHISNLYAQLFAEPASQKMILALPPEAVYSPPGSFRSVTGVYKTLRDGFGFDMDYQMIGGAGGKPVVNSAGVGGHFPNGFFDPNGIGSDGVGR
jgi:prepilin-type N-terminal cleavage/methylation domain-containing protein